MGGSRSGYDFEGPHGRHSPVARDARGSAISKRDSSEHLVFAPSDPQGESQNCRGPAHGCEVNRSEGIPLPRGTMRSRDKKDKRAFQILLRRAIASVRASEKALSVQGEAMVRAGEATGSVVALQISAGLDACCLGLGHF